MMTGNGRDGVKISAEDRRFFLHCLEHRFLTQDHAQKSISPGCATVSQGQRPAIYYRLYRLVKAGFLRKELLQNREVFLLERKGLNEICNLNKYNLPLVQPNELKNVEHDLLVADARYYFEFHVKADWISERLFLHQPQTMRHIPDGAFILDNTPIGVEVELTRKSIERYRQIAEYFTRKGPDRIVYFYRDPAVVSPLAEMTRHMERFGFFPFSENAPPMAQLIGQTQGREVQLDQFLRKAK